MENMYFDLNNPFEKQVSERLENYMTSGLSMDDTLDAICRDFPFMDNKVREHCENTAFIYYHSGQDGKPAGFLKNVHLLNYKNLDEPLCSHLGHSFHIKKGEDLIAAVSVENPLYLYDDVGVDIKFFVNGIQVNQIVHTLSMSDNRNVYYVCLCLEEKLKLIPDSFNVLKIDITNEHIKGESLSVEAEVYYGEQRPSRAFNIDDYETTLASGLNYSEVFDLATTGSLNFHTAIDYSGLFGTVTSLEGELRIAPVSDDKKQNTIVRFLNLSKVADESRYEGDCNIRINIPGIRKDMKSEPAFELQEGCYHAMLWLMGELIWCKEIKFVGKPDRREENLQEFLSEMGAENVLIHTDEEKTQLDPFKYITPLAMELYDIDCDHDDKTRCLDRMHNTTPQKSFRSDELKMLSVLGVFKERLSAVPLTHDHICKWCMYDQNGNMVASQTADLMIWENKLLVYAAFGDFCHQNWSEGRYRLELSFDTTLLMNGEFIIEPPYTSDISYHCDDDMNMDNENDDDTDIKEDKDNKPALASKRYDIITAPVEGSALEKLEKMAGLTQVKKKIRSLMSFHKLQKMRSEAGLPVKMPALHARFLGNPGTGKTTVAGLLGQIYKEMGVLSSGHVVVTERKYLVGKYYHSAPKAVEAVINKAKGGILLIDEAYNLFTEKEGNDPGRDILESLLTALSDENNRDWMLILAGYTKEMEAMLKSNPGLKSRVSEVFNFEDLTIDELVSVADHYCEENKYKLSDEARERLKSVIIRDKFDKDNNFGNGRHVKKVLEATINQHMATRLATVESPTFDQLTIIEADDIPIDPVEARRISNDAFDNDAIDEALGRLDSLVGLSKVKQSIHNFVNVSRFLHSQGERYRGKGVLRWTFSGSTGTGKSTVAQILADILRAMNLIKSNQLTEIKGEELFNVSEYTYNEIIRQAVEKSRNGMLFIDGDSPQFSSEQYRMIIEQIKSKLSTLADNEDSSGALVIAECSTPELSIAHSLASNGIYDFNHTFIFDDYSDDELYGILLHCLAKMKTSVSEDAEVILKEFIRNIGANRNLGMANARTMKNLSRAIFEIVVLRMFESSDPKDERIVLGCDVESIVWKNPKKIGF